MDKARFLETFKAIERDYAECVNKELDTDQELAIQKTFKQNLSRLLEILVDAKAPDELANEVKDIQGHLEKWDVYAFWFKEVKNLVRGIKSLMEHLGMYMDANDILPKATPAPVPKPVAPVAPSVQPAMSETKALPARAIPALKPVFKIPPVKAPLTATGPAPSPTSPPFEGAPDISPKPVPVSEPRPLTPVPLGTKLEVHVKPAGILATKPAAPLEPAAEVKPGGLKPVTLRPLTLKPVQVKSPSETTTGAGSASVPMTGSAFTVAGGGRAGGPGASKTPALSPVSKPVPPKLAPVVASSSMSGNASAGEPVPDVRLVKPSTGERPLLVPKPIKIQVPDLDHIDIDEEVGVAAGRRPATVNKVTPEKPVAVPVKIRLTPYGSAVSDSPPEPGDKVDSLIDSIADEIKTAKKAPDAGPVVSKTAPAGLDSDVDARVNALAKMIESDGDWDEEAISGLLDDMASTAPSDAPASTFLSTLGAKKQPNDVQGKGQGDSGLLLNAFMPSAPPDLDKGGQKKGGKLQVMSEEPPRARLTSITRPAGDGQAPALVPRSIPLAPAEKQVPMKAEEDLFSPSDMTDTSTAADPMSLFTGALQSKLRDKKPAANPGGSLSFFSAPLIDSPEPTTATASKVDSKQKRQKPVPIGSEVDVATLPETRDGLLQMLIALEGKRFTLETSKRELKTSMEKGTISKDGYQQKITALKVEMDALAEQINGIRIKIKKM